MNKEQLQHLKDLCSAATPGPWEQRPVKCLGTWDVGSSAIYHWPYSGERAIRCEERDDAAFIAAARSALPELIAEVERLEAELSKVRADYLSLLGQVIQPEECDVCRLRLKGWDIAGYRTACTCGGRK
jgi:hypothetical protein